MGDVFDQATPPQQQSATATQGDVFDQASQPDQSGQPSQPDQPGFWQRAYETSPLPGVINAAKQSVSDFVKGPDDAAQAFNEMIGSLSQGNFSDAAHHAAKLLTGSENPFSDAAKSVIAGITKDAHQAGRDVQNRNIAAIPVVGEGAQKYIDDVKAGNTSGAIGDVVGTATSVLPALLGDEASVTKAKTAAGSVADGAADAAGKVKPFVSEEAAAATAQPEVQSAIRDAAERENIKTRAIEGSAPEAPPSIRDAVEDVGDTIKARSKATFSQLDEASGGRWQRFDDALSNLRDKMDESAGVDDEAFEKYSQRAQDIEAAQNDLVNQLVKDGKIDPDAAEGAKADYKQANALYDVSQQIRNSTSGLRPEIGEGTPETVDPSKLSPRLNRLYDFGRLQEALGDEGAAKLVQQVDEALRQKQSAIKTAKLVKTVAKYGAAAVGLGALGHGAAAILGGGK